MKLAEGWKRVTLQELALVDSGQGAPQGEKWYTGEEVFVKAGDLNYLSDGKYVGDFCKKIGFDAIHKYKLKKYSKNSIVFPKSGMSIRTNNIALLKYDSYVVNHLAVVQAKNENSILAKYIYYALKAKEPAKLSLNEGYPSIRISDLKELKIEIPPENILGRIVTVLEKAEQLRDWRKQSDMLTNEFLYSVFLKMFGNFKNPKNCGIQELGKFITSVTSGSRLWKNYYSKSGARFIRAQNLDNGKLDFSDLAYINPPNNAESKRTQVKPRDVLISITGKYVGQSAVVPEDIGEAYVSQHVALLKLKDSINPYFVAYFISLPSGGQIQISKESYGQTKPGLNLNQIKKLKVITPPLGAQNEFASIVKKIEQMQAKQEASQDLIDNLCKIMTKELMEIK